MAVYLWNFETLQDTYKRHQTHEYCRIQTELAKTIHQINLLLPPGSVVFNVRTGSYIDIMAFTGHTAYPGLPDQQVLDSLRSLNRKAAVLKGEVDWPDYIKQDTNILKLPYQGHGYY